MSLSDCSLSLVECEIVFFVLPGPAGFLRVQQKSEFATSAFRSKVREALQFRNMFAVRPFVCHLLMGDHNDHNTVIDAVEHGATVEWPDHPRAVDVAENGRLMVHAVRPASCVVQMASNRQEFRSEFSVRLPPSSLKDGAGFTFVRVTGHHSLRHVPDCWRPAANLLLRSIGEELLRVSFRVMQYAVCHMEISRIRTEKCNFEQYSVRFMSYIEAKPFL